MVTVEAIVHGAVSIVSAIATGNGATLGIAVSYTHLTLPTNREV